MRQRIAALVSECGYKEAIAYHARLHSESIPPHQFTFPPLLKACAKLGSLLQGTLLHSLLIKTGFRCDTYTATSLAHMYLVLARPDNAIKVFDEMPEKSVASVNAVISGLSRNGFFQEALSFFGEVGSGYPGLNSVTIASVLGACKSAGLCEQMHCWAVKLGVETDEYVATSLVTAYSECGEMVPATRAFGEIPVRNVVSYNALISGLLLNHLPAVALTVFNEMRETLAVRPNSITLASILSASAGLGYLQFGRQVHGLLVKNEVVLGALVGTALVDMYSKCHRWQCSYDLFNELGETRNLVTWNTMIAGSMLNGRSDNAVELFELMELEGLKPDSVTWNSMISGFARLDKGSEAVGFLRRMLGSGAVPSLKSMTSILPACASLSALLYGKEIHGQSIRMDIAADEFLATALVDMYMKCGFPSWARRVFDQFEIKPKDPALWNALVSGYGRNGEFESAICMFDQMLRENVKPNSATFAAVLSACGHAGQVDIGCQVFSMMVADCNLNPNAEHVGCMVDLLGRSGRVEEAGKLVRHMQQPPAPLLASLLGACKHHLNYEVGEEMAMKLSELEPDDPSPFVIMSNIYAELGRWEDVERVRRIINDTSLRKELGFSSIGIT